MMKTMMKKKKIKMIRRKILKVRLKKIKRRHHLRMRWRNKRK